MSKYSRYLPVTILFLLIILLLANIYYMFFIKSRSYATRMQIIKLNKEIENENKKLNILEVGLVLQTNPSVIKQLSDKYLHLSFAKADSIYSLSEIINCKKKSALANLDKDSLKKCRNELK